MADIICLAIIGKQDGMPLYCHNTTFELIRDKLNIFRTKCSKCGEIGTNEYKKQ